MPVSRNSSDSQPDRHALFSSPQHPASTSPSSNPPASSPPHNAIGDHDKHTMGGFSRPSTRKRTRLQFSLPSEETAPQAALDPCKKIKMVHTTVSVQRSREVDDLHSLRMLELARASRNAFDAHLNYCRLRLQEIEVMRTIAIDQCEEAATWLHQAETQIGGIRHVLHVNGTAIGESGITLFNSRQNDKDEVSVSVSEAGHKRQPFRSPTPSDRDEDD